MSTVEVHGQHVPVPEIDDGETVLDVMIMARVVSVAAWVVMELARGLDALLGRIKK